MSAEEKQPEAAAQAPAGEVKTETQAADKKEEKAAAPTKIEKGANCPVCNKSMKKKWYYRNNKYYCCKGCWQTDFKKSKTEAEKKPA